MRRAKDITDAELRSFCEWFAQRFKSSQQRQWLGKQIEARQTRREWLMTSLEGVMHCPARDVKRLLRRMSHLKLIKVHDNYVELIKP